MRNGTKYESEFRDILKSKGHIALLGSVVSVDCIDVCHSALFEVKSSLKITDRPHIALDTPRLVKQFHVMQEYSKSVKAFYVVRYRNKKWYYYQVNYGDPIPTSLEYISDANVPFIIKGNSIKGVLKPIEDMDFLNL